MYASKLVFSQVIDHLPIHTFRRCDRCQFGNRLPATASSHQIPRCPDRQDFQLPDQQLRQTGTNRCRSVSLPLAGRAFLQMDQTAPAHQILLRRLRECRQKPDLDSHLGLRARGNYQKTPRYQSRSLHNSTGFELDPV